MTKVTEFRVKCRTCGSTFFRETRDPRLTEIFPAGPEAQEKFHQAHGANYYACDCGESQIQNFEERGTRVTERA